MSTTRIKGANGVIIDSEAYLELPKGSGVPANMPLRPGMIRYNINPDEPLKSGVQLANTRMKDLGLGEEETIEWGTVVTTDPETGKLDTLYLPDSVTAGLDYIGQWDATTATPALGTTGQFYIVTVAGNGYDVGDWLISDGTAWDQVPVGALKTTDAALVNFDSSGSRSKHGSANQSMQVQTQNLITSALDRLNSDTVEGNISFTGSALLRVINGSAGTPALSFTNDTNTGLYLDVDNVIGIATAGAERMTISASATKISSTQVFNSSGQTTKPAYSFIADADTGMYLKANGTLAMATSGQDRLVMDVNGFTLGGQVKFDNGTAAAPSITFASDTNTGIYRVSDNNLGIATGGALVANFDIGHIDFVKPTRMANDSMFGYNFTDGSPTGMNFDGTDLQLRHQGREIIALNNSRNTGTAEFHVNIHARTADMASPAFSFQDAPDTGLYNTGTTIMMTSAGDELASFNHTSIRLGEAGGTGNVRIGSNGTQANPALGLGNSNQAGLYSNGSLMLVGNGSTVAEMASWEAKFNVPVRVPGGSATAPSFSFDADDNTGFYHISENVIGVAVGATNVGQFNGNGFIPATAMRNQNGSATVPSYSFASDTNTGMYRKAADTLGFSVAGAERLALSSAGMTSTVALTLPNGTAAAPTLKFSDADTGLYYTSAGVNVTHNNSTVATFGASSTIKKLTLPQGSTIGGSNLANASLLVGTTANGIGFDENEIIKKGGDLIISSADGDIQLGRAGATVSILGNLSFGGLSLNDKFFEHTAGSNTTDVTTLIKNPKYNGSYQRSNTGPVGYAYGTLVNLSSDSGRFQMYAPHYTSINGGNRSAVYIRTGWGDDIKPWTRLLTDNDVITTALNSNQLEGLTKAQVVAEARSGLITQATADGRYWRRTEKVTSAGTADNATKFNNWTVTNLRDWLQDGSTAANGQTMDQRYHRLNAKAPTATTADNSGKVNGWTVTQLRDWLQNGSTSAKNQTMDTRYLNAGSTAVNSSKLEGSTKAQVVAEARSGYVATSTLNSLWTNGTYLKSTSKWVQAASNAVGFLPATSGTTGNSYLGTSSWYFNEAWVRNYRGYAVNVSNNITAYSDLRLKSNLEVIPNALDKIDLISGYTYDKTVDGETWREAGVIAQEIEEVLPEVVQENDDGIKSVAYGNIVGLLIEGIKEEKAKREELEDRVAALEDLVQQLLNK